MSYLDERMLYKAACKKWGIKFQFDLLKEECAELIVAASKMTRARRNESDDYMQKASNLCEEIADVEIMISQIKTTCDSLDVLVFNHKKMKLERLYKLVKDKL